jgi:hypothetical protein
MRDCIYVIISPQVLYYQFLDVISLIRNARIIGLQEVIHRVKPHHENPSD